MRTVRYTFPVISRSQDVRCECFTCSERFSRTVRVSQTVNPFNRNADGVPKTRDEVLLDVVTELKEKVTALKNDIEIHCTPCKAYREDKGR